VRRERFDCNQSCCSATDIWRRSLDVGCRVTDGTVERRGVDHMNPKPHHDDETLNSSQRPSAPVSRERPG
jgi:hypothetical protein